MDWGVPMPICKGHVIDKGTNYWGFFLSKKGLFFQFFFEKRGPIFMPFCFVKNGPLEQHTSVYHNIGAQNCELDFRIGLTQGS